MTSALPRFTRRDALVLALIEAGPRGLTYREIVRRRLAHGRFVDVRMREIERDHRLRVELGHGDDPRRPFRWVYLGAREPLADTRDVDAQVSLLPDRAGAAPACALTGGES